MTQTTAIDPKEELIEARHWISEIKRAQKKFHNWELLCDKINKRYLDEREAAQKDIPRFNILWSNVQTLKPALYAKPPKPVVQRRYLDRDPVARLASQMLQRALTHETEGGDFHDTISMDVDDYLLNARGQAWVRYEPTFETTIVVDPSTQQPVPQEKITAETMCVDFLNRKDFLHEPSRVWRDVRWVAKRTFYSYNDLVKLCGEEIADKVPFDVGPEGSEPKIYSKLTGEEEMRQACVWEIWYKTEKRVYWVSEHFPERCLKTAPDPLKLERFFPCPKPLYATLTNDSLVPTPDYKLYESQAIELDDLTARIDKLVAACRVAGAYNAAVPELARLFKETYDNDLIPIANFAAFAQAGGLKGAMDFVPIEQIVAVLRELYQARENVKQTIYEITGISDIVRGQGQASETATAQQIKGQYAALRLQDRQAEVARFARDLVRIMAEIICEHYQPETILKISSAKELEGSDRPEFPQVVQQALALLKDEQSRGFRVDIETDSTIYGDETAEKQSRIEFLQAVGGFLQQSLPVAQAQPAMVPLLGRMLLFGVRAFRAGRELETAFEDALTQMGTAPPAQQEQKPDPKEIAEDARTKAIVLKSQADMTKTRMDMQLNEQKFQQDMVRAQMGVSEMGVVQ